MSTFAILLLCIQACLVQNAFGQFHGACGGPALAIAPAPAAALGGALGLGAYCGAIGHAHIDTIAPAAALGGALGLGAYCGAIGHAHIDTIAPAAAYGGTGEGNVAVTGELPVGGNTAIAGTVPIIGAVNFGGAVPAAGAVSISGKCACGCGAPLIY